MNPSKPKETKLISVCTQQVPISRGIHIQNPRKEPAYMDLLGPCQYRLSLRTKLSGDSDYSKNIRTQGPECGLNESDQCMVTRGSELAYYS